MSEQNIIWILVEIMQFFFMVNRINFEYHNAMCNIAAYNWILILLYDEIILNNSLKSTLIISLIY